MFALCSGIVVVTTARLKIFTLKRQCLLYFFLLAICEGWIETNNNNLITHLSNIKFINNYTGQILYSKTSNHHNKNYVWEVMLFYNKKCCVNFELWQPVNESLKKERISSRKASTNKTTNQVFRASFTYSKHNCPYKYEAYMSFHE